MDFFSCCLSLARTAEPRSDALFTPVKQGGSPPSCYGCHYLQEEYRPRKSSKTSPLPLKCWLESRLLAAVSSSKMESPCHCSKSFLSILNATHRGFVFNSDTAHGCLQGFAEAPGTTSSYLLALAFIGPQVIQEKNPASSKRHLIAASMDLQSISAPMHLPQGFLPLLVPQPRTSQPGRYAKGTTQPHHPRNPNSHPPPRFFTL